LSRDDKNQEPDTFIPFGLADNMPQKLPKHVGDDDNDDNNNNNNNTRRC